MREIIEEKIRDLVKEIIPVEDAIRIKKVEQPDLEDDLVIKLVKQNYSKNFLCDLNNEKDNVLVMGINPGGGNEILSDERLKCYGFNCLDQKIINDNEKVTKLYRLFCNKYIWQNYHYNNYKLFEDINGKMSWICKTKEDLENELKKILNCEKIPNELQQEYIEAFNYIYDKEKQKKGPVIVFSDLLYYCDGNQGNIKSIIAGVVNKEGVESFNEKIRKIINLYIEYYKPKILVVTNAYASDLINQAFYKECNNKVVESFLYENNNVKTQILFSGMVSGKRPLDKYSFIRLKNEITEKYNQNIK